MYRQFLTSELLSKALITNNLSGSSLCRDRSHFEIEFRMNFCRSSAYTNSVELVCPGYTRPSKLAPRQKQIATLMLVTLLMLVTIFIRANELRHKNIGTNFEKFH